MLWSINFESSVAVYQQIKNSVRFAIASGHFKTGDRLPPAVELGQILDLNFNTVNKAYRELEIVGLIESRKGVGVFVRKGADKKCRASCLREISGRLHEVVQEAKAAGLEKRAMQELFRLCYAIEGPPYRPPPKSILKLAKQ